VFPGTKLLKCLQVGKDIETCQQRGKRVLLSLGGADGSYGLSNEGQAHVLAAQVWNLFLGGWSATRPFGSVKLDGIDLDLEAGSPSHFGAFVRSLKGNFTADSSKKYYISYVHPPATPPLPACSRT
jgi:chitinase